MIESCTIAYLKEFCIAFMLYLILILTYDANSIIFTFKMKPLMPQICQENFPFKKSGDLDHEEKHFQIANQDLMEFYQRILLATKKAILGPRIKTPSTASSSPLKNQRA